ncbi:MAG: hypothetical protein DSZ12_00035 [Sulfurovum sp.]|nr:MAG: hypothetical protein DSZ12_00035 [Sulfurovum sp.]
MMQEIIDKINLHKSRAKLAQKEIRAFDNELSVEIFEDFEKVKTIDTFIYRFIKFQDMMGEKLFRYFLDELGEYKESMSLLDILDKLEKLGFIDDAMQWMQYRKLRNKLTHEYPNNEDEIVEGIILALQTFDEMEAIFNTIIEYKKV